MPAIRVQKPAEPRDDDVARRTPRRGRRRPSLSSCVDAFVRATLEVRWSFDGNAVIRLRPLDALLLALVVPIWGAWFSFFVYSGFADRATWVPVNVAAARSAGDYPVVTWVNPHWAGRGGLAVGDVLIRAGDEELRGVGHIGFQARVREAAGEGFRVPVASERGGQRPCSRVPGN